VASHIKVAKLLPVTESCQVRIFQDLRLSTHRRCQTFNVLHKLRSLE